MVYLIDDKKSRQVDYGWDDSKIAEYNSNLVTIYNIEELEKCYKENMLEEGSTILLHESFVSSVKKEAQGIYEDFKNELDSKESALYVSYFSGSKSCRYVQDNVCMLSPSTLYENLETFLLHEFKGDISLKYLAFGERYDYELELTKRVMKITETDPNKVSTNKNIFFAVTSDTKYALDSPFRNITANSDWEIFGNDISDTNLDKVILNNFCVEKYDAIYIPLCFGNTYSDFMGLRLALHLRLTQCVNQTTRLFIYGVVPLEDLMHNECFDVLKLSGVSLIESDYESIINSDKEQIINEVSINEELDNIRLTVPNNIGDNHSFANRWAIYRWREMIDWGANQPEIFDNSFIKSLYFKYLIAKFGAHDSFRKDKYKYKCEISNIEKKRIVYIDDEYNLGWENIINTLIEASGAKLICYKGFDKKINKTEQIGDIEKFLNENDADCYLLDLRLHSDDFDDNASLSGHEIAAYIKTLNQGNQIVVFTASNKALNLKKEIQDIGALTYVIKESPEQLLTRQESYLCYVELEKAIKSACAQSYIKDLVNLIKESGINGLEGLVDALILDKTTEKKRSLKIILLLIVFFVEDYFKNRFMFIDNISENQYTLKQSEKGGTWSCKIKEKLLRLKGVDSSQYNSSISEYLFIGNAKEKEKEDSSYEWAKSKKNNGDIFSTTLIACVLKFYYNRDQRQINKFMAFIRTRDFVAHQNGECGIPIADVIDIINDIIKPILENPISIPSSEKTN